MDYSNGPFLAYAVLCERVLRETDGVITLVRIIDKLIAREPKPVQHTFHLAVAFKSGEFSGPLELPLKIVTPSGRSEVLGSLPFFFKGEEHGSVAAIELTLVITERGLFWIDVCYPGEDQGRITRVPLRVMDQEVTGGKVPDQIAAD